MKTSQLPLGSADDFLSATELLSKGLSYTAVGLYAYISEFPESQSFPVESLTEASKSFPHDVLPAIQELIDAGLLQISQSQEVAA